MKILLNIFIFLIPQILTNSFISLPFSVNYLKEKPDSSNIIKHLTKKDILVEIKLGSKKESFYLSLNLKSYATVIASSQNKNINSKTFNELDSKTFSYLNETKIKPLVDVYNEALLSQDKLLINNIEISKYNFILSINQTSNNSGTIGLKYERDIIESKLVNSTNFINQLKNNKIIGNGNFYINFENENKGNFVLGKNLYNNDNNNNLISVKSFSDNNGAYRWSFCFDQVKINNKSLYVKNKQECGEISSDFGLIVGSTDFYYYINKKYFENKKECEFKKEGIYYYFICDKNTKFDDDNKFNFEINLFENKEIKFNFDKNELFYNFNDKIIFKILFMEDNNFWRFGHMFLHKYNLMFNNDEHTIGFYQKENKFIQPLNYFKILSYILIAIIICMILIYFYLGKEKLFNFNRENEINEKINYIKMNNDEDDFIELKTKSLK